MADGISISVDAKEALALFDRLGAAADYVCSEVALDTAKRIVAEAQRRVARATGETARGIHFEVTHDGKGYVVLMGDATMRETTFSRLSARQNRIARGGRYARAKQVPHTGIYLEFGTKFHRPRPFLFSSAELEEGPHLRRLVVRIQQWLDEEGR
jgi:hypothetical protein